MLEKTLQSPLDGKEIKPVYPKKKKNPKYSLEGLMLKDWYFGSHDAKSLVIRKDSDAGKDWGQEEKGTTKDEMVG